jgi:hypothetical protein
MDAATAAGVLPITRTPVFVVCACKVILVISRIKKLEIRRIIFYII